MLALPSFVPFDPTDGSPERFHIGAAIVDPSPLLAGNQAGFFKDPQMLGNSGQGNVKRCGQFGDGEFSQHQPLEHCPSSGVGQGSKDGIK
jgi:hypothetical protein